MTADDRPRSPSIVELYCDDQCRAAIPTPACLLVANLFFASFFYCVSIVRYVNLAQRMSGGDGKGGGRTKNGESEGLEMAEIAGEADLTTDYVEMEESDFTDAQVCQTMPLARTLSA